jgi:hypothetical protein
VHTQHDPQSSSVAVLADVYNEQHAEYNCVLSSSWHESVHASASQTPVDHDVCGVHAAHLFRSQHTDFSYPCRVVRCYGYSWLHTQRVNWHWGASETTNQNMQAAGCCHRCGEEVHVCPCLFCVEPGSLRSVQLLTGYKITQVPANTETQDTVGSRRKRCVRSPTRLCHRHAGHLV